MLGRITALELMRRHGKRPSRDQRLWERNWSKHLYPGWVTVPRRAGLSEFLAAWIATRLLNGRAESILVRRLWYGRRGNQLLLDAVAKYLGVRRRRLYSNYLFFRSSEVYIRPIRDLPVTRHRRPTPTIVVDETWPHWPEDDNPMDVPMPLCAGAVLVQKPAEADEHKQRTFDALQTHLIPDLARIAHMYVGEPDAQPPVMMDCLGGIPLPRDLR